jgi:hypothetical protein
VDTLQTSALSPSTEIAQAEKSCAKASVFHDFFPGRLSWVGNESLNRVYNWTNGLKILPELPERARLAGQQDRAGRLSPPASLRKA